MATKAPKPAAHGSAADTTAAVDAYMAALDHPGKPLVEAIRRAVLGADASIAEGIKWNAPSYRTTEYFATTHLRDKRGVGLILHRGAKVRAAAAGGLAIDDPAGLLEWLAPDRARIVFTGAADLAARRGALQALLRQWIAFV